MQIVIDIPESILNTIQADEMISREQLAVLQMHILNGTPLPEVHGYLVDRNAINDRFYAILAELESLPNKPTHKEVLNKLSMCLDTAEPIIKHNYAESEE